MLFPLKKCRRMSRFIICLTVQAKCADLIKTGYIIKNMTVAHLLRMMLASSGMTAAFIRVCSYCIIPTHIYIPKEENVMHIHSAT